MQKRKKNMAIEYNYDYFLELVECKFEKVVLQI
jgi:hypothetical protein